MDTRQSPAILLGALFATSCGSFGLVTAVGKQVYDLTGRALDLGLLGLAEFLPAALLVLVTGALADRLDRRRLAATAALGVAAVAALLALYAASRPTTVGPIFALTVAFGVARAFLAPALRSLPADTLPSDRLPAFVPRWSLMTQAAMIAGPVLAGSLYAVDPAAPLAASAALFAAGAAALPFVRPQSARAAAGAGPAGAGDAGAPAVGDRAVGIEALAAGPADARAGDEAGTRVGGGVPHGATGTDGSATSDGPRTSGTRAPPPGEPGERRASEQLREALAGLRFIRRHPVLLGVISLDLFAVLFGGAVALLPAIAEERLGVGSVGFGWLRAATGIGAAAVTLVLATRPVTRHVGRLLLGAVAVFGLATIALGATRSYAVAFAALVVLSGADALSVFIRATLVPLATPADTRGRVLAVENVFIGASNELGAFESGVVGQLLGPALAVVLGGVATLGIAGIWWVLFPALRDIDRFPDGSGTPAAPRRPDSGTPSASETAGPDGDREVP